MRKEGVSVCLLHQPLYLIVFLFSVFSLYQATSHTGWQSAFLMQTVLEEKDFYVFVSMLTHLAGCDLQRISTQLF